MPRMCADHRKIYATRVKALQFAVRRPGVGRKALAREAELVAGQCPGCGAA